MAAWSAELASQEDRPWNPLRCFKFSALQVVTECFLYRILITTIDLAPAGCERMVGLLRSEGIYVISSFGRAQDIVIQFIRYLVWHRQSGLGRRQFVLQEWMIVVVEKCPNNRSSLEVDHIQSQLSIRQ